ncbi:hypothetical protein FNV43_RR00728 [Rhamnella rubrinervis]|uniref:Uncharacterized protein n=1 Tax=Rhamnella rubrinervis TaxID=2594499 RepID=A0A8K0HP67_9ROSA|nr:hypothetical protein FNV43_RR00728 [Rhamnella rubrinervis]
MRPTDQLLQITRSVQVALEMVKGDFNGSDKAFSTVLGQRTIERNQLLVSIAKSVSFGAHHTASLVGMRVEAYAFFFTDCSLAQNALQKFQVVGDAD